MRAVTQWALGALGLAALWGCATPAVVFISPNYASQNIKRVTLLGFNDVPGQQGSGSSVADVFEKYLFNLNYEVIDPNRAQQALQAQHMTLDDGLSAAGLAVLGKTLNVDAVISGSVSEITNASEQTVMVDVPQEVTEPVYQQVAVRGRHGRVHTVTQQTGVQTYYNDQMVPETVTMPARVGISARMVSVKNAELLWSGSGSADGMAISSAAEAVASKVIAALQKNLTAKKPS
jgi:hypothetical protein